MALFQEIDLTTFSGGQITGIEPNSVADEIGLQTGDALLAINDHKCIDIIDVQFYGADESLELLIRRGEELLLYEAEREYNQTLGMEFDHPTFDIDVRRCENLCGFCFVLQMAPRFRRTLYIKDDDYRYSFLFGYFVTLTNLKPSDWERIRVMGLSPLYISVHVTDLQLRRDFLRNQNAPDVMDQLRQLADWGMEAHTQLVVVPEFNDGKWLKQSVEELAALWPTVRSISVVPVGLTGFHKYKMRGNTPAEAAATLAYVEAMQPQFQEKFGIRFVYPTDEWYLVADRTVPPTEAYDGQELEENGLGQVRRFLTDWEGVQNEIAEYDGELVGYESLTFVTAALFAKTLGETAVSFTDLTTVPITVIPIENIALGGTITVAGLLMAKDVIAQLKETTCGDLIILPHVMFDHPNRITLDDIGPQQVANELNIPIALADTMGDVWDALIGANTLLFEPKKNDDFILLEMNI